MGEKTRRNVDPESIRARRVENRRNDQNGFNSSRIVNGKTQGASTVKRIDGDTGDKDTVVLDLVRFGRV